MRDREEGGLFVWLLFRCLIHHSPGTQVGPPDMPIRKVYPVTPTTPYVNHAQHVIPSSPSALPVPRVIARRASLTANDDLSDPKVQRQGAEEQRQSRLFQLPPEVRDIIYGYVLTGPPVHIVQRQNKLGHRRCRSNGSPYECVKSECRGIKVETGHHVGSGDGGIIQLLQTCRQA
jgi:hypothetical protein